MPEETRAPTAPHVWRGEQYHPQGRLPCSREMQSKDGSLQAAPASCLGEFALTLGL